tara:strand:+ start:1042 stop:2472 length:1431 start_codon:yes stop_codon:yes gene_type:complete
MNQINELIIESTNCLRDALALIDNNGKGICIVTSSRKIVGVATDGDIRRFLLENNDLNAPVSKAMNRDFIALHKDTSDSLIRKSFTNGVKIIPLYDDQHHVVDIADVNQSHRIPVLEPELCGNELIYIQDCLESNWISSQGKYVYQFEAMFSEIHHNLPAIAVSSGTTALHLSLVALGIGKGDEVIIPNVTFAACANAVIHAGAEPVLCEIDSTSWCLDINEANKLISNKTKAIMAVHLYGQVCDMNNLIELTKKNGLYLIEDCAESIGSSYNNQIAGTFGDASAFSFFGNKTISTGEGGMVLFKDKNIYSKAKILRDHGMSPDKRYWHEVVGFNYRITNLQAAIGVAQLERLDVIIKKKIEIARYYKKHLSGIKSIISKPRDIPNVVSSNWLYTIILEKSINRDSIIDELTKIGIETRPVFYPINSMKPYINFKSSKILINSHNLSNQGLSLPTSINLKEEDIIYICNSLSRVLK